MKQNEVLSHQRESRTPTLHQPSHMLGHTIQKYTLHCWSSTAVCKRLNPETHRPTVGRLKRLGKLGGVRDQICSVCSAALEAFGTAWTASAPIQHVKSEEVSEDSLIGGVLVNQCGVWEGEILCALCFSMHSLPSCPVFMFWSTGRRLVPPAVREAYCISHKHRTYTLLWSWQPCVECNT